MKGQTRKVFVLVTIAVFILIAGCDQQNQSNTRKSRLVAVENLKLKEQLQQRDNQIKRKEELLKQCWQEKKALQNQLGKERREELNDVFGDILEHSQKLQQENKELKARVKKLETKLKELEQKLPSPL